jgi:hypothetical protein
MDHINNKMNWLAQVFAFLAKCRTRAIIAAAPPQPTKLGAEHQPCAGDQIPTPNAERIPPLPCKIGMSGWRRPPEELRAALLASLEVVPCAVCANDIAAGISAERAESDSAHCDCCDLNWPTRIEIGNSVLEKRQRGIE